MPERESSNLPKILFVCATSREYEVIKATIFSAIKSTHGTKLCDKFIEYGIEYNGVIIQLEVAIINSEKGNLTVFSKLYNYVIEKPSHIVFVGSAGSLKDCTIGDLVIPTQVSYYEIGKEFKNETEGSTIRLENSPNFLLKNDIVRAHKGNSAWEQFVLPKEYINNVNVHFGHVMSGEKVLTDVDGLLYRKAKLNNPSALCVDMETAGFFMFRNEYKENIRKTDADKAW